MYTLINRNADLIVSEIPGDFVRDYEQLFTNMHEAELPRYQKLFRKYWAMNAAQLGPEFYRVYFNLLATAGGDRPSLNEVCCKLYECSTRRNGKKSLQFSFATKLLHMWNPQLPIYDSYVAAFYFFEPPSPEEQLDERIKTFVGFHDFLIREYRRVLDRGLLETAIGKFRNKLGSHKLGQEKVIDSLIWKTAELLTKGALVDGRISYS